MPTDEEVARAIELIRETETNYRYFFDRLDDPSWLRPLAENGFFRDPPDAVTTDDGKGYYFPDWPESRALQRLAPRAPQAVYELLQRIDPRRNDRVRSDVVRTAAALPVGMAASVAEREMAWIAKQSELDFGLPSSFAELIAALATGGEGKVANGLARSLFALRPTGQRVGWLGAKALMEPYEFSETARSVFADLSAHDARSALALAEELLEEAMALGAGGPENAPVDHSDIWRPAIENRAENFGDDAAETLIVLVRDLARELVTARPEDAGEILARLRGRRWQVFWRIGLYVLVELHSEHPQLAEQWLLEPELFFCERVRHEYLALARRGLSGLGGDEQAKWRSMLDEGPQYEGLATPALREAAGVDEEAWKGMRERWRRDRLAVIGDGLPEDLRGELAALVDRQGEPDSPDLSGVKTWVGPTSPVTTDELRSMSAEEVIDVLTRWQPEGEHLAPSPEGLGRLVADRVAEGPDGFTEQWGAVLDLEPTYVRSILSGFEKAVRDGTTLDWDPVLSLSHEVVRKPDEPAAREPGWNEHDPDWGWARKTVAGLIVVAIERRAIPTGLAPKTWGALEPLTWDRDPSPDQETSMDPLTFSINTTRGQAMHAAIALGAMLATDGERKIEDPETFGRVLDNLEQHLDPERETSPAVRAAFGARMAALINIGEDWFVRQLPALLPADIELGPLRAVVWDSFLAWTRPHEAFLRTLRPWYAEAAAEAGGEDGEDGLGRDPRLGLAEHLASYYMWGYIPLDDDLLSTFFNAASTPAAAHVTSFVGRGLDRLEEDLPEDVRHRMMALWEWLVARFAPDENPERRPIFEPFGWWFGAGQLDARWELAQFDAIVRQHVVVDPEFRVLPRLQQLLTEDPRGVLVALKHYLEVGGPGWRLASASREIRAILEAARSEEDPRVANEIQQIASLMIDRGMIDFRDLTEPPRPA